MGEGEDRGVTRRGNRKKVINETQEREGKCKRRDKLREKKKER